MMFNVTAGDADDAFPEQLFIKKGVLNSQSFSSSDTNIRSDSKVATLHLNNDDDAGNKLKEKQKKKKNTLRSRHQNERIVTTHWFNQEVRESIDNRLQSPSHAVLLGEAVHPCKQQRDSETDHRIGSINVLLSSER